MRTSVLIALCVSLAGCAAPKAKHPYAEANSLMTREIEARIANFPFQHGQELLNNMLWLETKAGESAIPFLLKSLKDESPKVRSTSVWILGRLRDRRVIPNLRPLVADQNEVVRLETARSLVMMGDLQFVPLLIEGLDSEKTPVRYNCHMALRDSTKKDFEYDHLEDDLQRRRAAVLRWREWWSKQSSDPWFSTSYANKHGLTTLTESPEPMGETKTGTKTETKTETPDDNGWGRKTTEPEMTPPPKTGAEQPATESKTGTTGTGSTGAGSTGTGSTGTESTGTESTGAEKTGSEKTGTDTPTTEGPEKTTGPFPWSEKQQSTGTGTTGGARQTRKDGDK